MGLVTPIKTTELYPFERNCFNLKKKPKLKLNSPTILQTFIMPSFSLYKQEMMLGGQHLSNAVYLLEIFRYHL